MLAAALACVLSVDVLGSPMASGLANPCATSGPSRPAPVASFARWFWPGETGTAHGQRSVVARGDGVTVAVVDTGIAPIAELRGSVWWSASKGFAPGGSLLDANGHGTEMASIVHDVAPAARLLVLRALDDSGGGSSRDVARAIRYAVQKGARVINLSAAGGAADPAVRDAISDADRHGALVVVAAGNNGVDLDAYPSFPAGYDLPNLVVVAATSGTSGLSPTSDWGARDVLLGAPGMDVPTRSIDGARAMVSGSSLAAALTSGVIALIVGEHPDSSVGDLRTALVRGSDPEPGLQGKLATGGRLNPTRALGGSVRISCRASMAFRP